MDLLWQAYQVLGSRIDQMNPEQQEALNVLSSFLYQLERDQLTLIDQANGLSLEALALLWSLSRGHEGGIVTSLRLHRFGIDHAGCRKGLWELVEIGDLIYSFSDNGHAVHAKIKPAGMRLIDSIRCSYKEPQTRFNNPIIQAMSRRDMFESQILAMQINHGMPDRLIQALVI